MKKISLLFSLLCCLLAGGAMAQAVDWLRQGSSATSTDFSNAIASATLTLGTPTHPTTCSGTGNIAFTSVGFTVGSTQTLSYRRNGVTPSLTQIVTIGSDGSFTLPNLTDGVYSNFTIGAVTASGSREIKLPTSCYFITRWDLSIPGTGATEISFYGGPNNNSMINYSWTEVGGGGATGSGTFNPGTVTITGLPSGGIIDLSISPTNLIRTSMLVFKSNDPSDTDVKRVTQIRQWGTAAWESMEDSFRGCSNMTLEATDVPNTAAVTSMAYMFAGCISFNQPLPENFNTENVTDMSSMFSNCTAYNQALPTSFNTAKVTNMSFMFASCTAYNKPLPDNFNTENVTTMFRMFWNCTSYNKPLPTSFNTAKVTDMSSMFTNCSAYNQPFPTNFNTAMVTKMSIMFEGATAFNQSLASFILNDNVNLEGILDRTFLSVANYDATLTAFNTQNVTGRTMGASGLKFCAAEADRANLVLPTASGGKGWRIFDSWKQCPDPLTPGTASNPTTCGGTDGRIPFTSIGISAGSNTLSYRKNNVVTSASVTIATDGSFTLEGLSKGIYSNFAIGTATTERFSILEDPASCKNFVTRWDLSKSNGSGPTQIAFRVGATGTVNYTWVEVGGDANGSGTFNQNSIRATITSLPPNAIIDLSISPTNFDRFNMSDESDKARLTEIKQWGTMAWINMANAFRGCSNMTLTATDVPNTASVTDMSVMFGGCGTFNQALPEGFTTAGVTNMSFMFWNCTAYNQALPTSFNTTNVTNMSAMFSGCTAYNKALPANFNTTRVTDMSYIFSGATAFNQSLAGFQLNANVNLGNFLDNTALSVANYDATLTAFNAQNVMGRTMGATGLKYCAAETDRDNLVLATASGGKGWTITDGGKLCATAATLTLGTPTNPTNCTSTPNGSIAFTSTGFTAGSSQTLNYKKDNVAAAPATITVVADGSFTLTGLGKGVYSDFTIGATAATGSRTLEDPALPTITTGTISAICAGATSFTIPYTASTGTPTTYSIFGTGITAVTDGTLPTSPITVNLSAAASGSSIPFTLTVKNTNGCTSSNITRSVTVNVCGTATLTLGTPTNPTNCTSTPNGSIAFTSTGFTVGSQTLNYKKDNVAATPATVTVAANGSFTLTGLGAGVYSDFAIGSTTATGSRELVLQTTLPQFTVSSNSPQCEKTGLLLGSSVSSSFDPSVVFIYAWTGPNGFTASTANASISSLLPSNAGTYNLQVTNPQTGCSATKSLVVEVYPLPAIPTITSSAMQMCKGESVLLTGSCSAATDIFRWTTPPLLVNGVASLGNTNQRTITAPSVYKGLCESNKGCLSAEVSITITERSNCNGLNFITVSPTKPVICPNASVVLTASGCGGTLTWFWGTSSQAGTSITASPSANTTYFVQCSTGGSTTVDVVVAQTAVQVANNIVTGQDRVKATDTITSDKKIGDANFTPAPSVIYEAGKSITLLPGFTAEKWSTFKAEIKTCNQQD